MARPSPSRADAARNSERILDTARHVFRERGPSVPFYEIARSAGVGQATLYRHFPNKQALVRAVVEENIVRLEEVARDADGESRRFDTLLTALAEQIAENAEVAALMATEVGTDWYEDLIGRIVDLLVTAMGEAGGPTERDLDREDLEIILRMLGGAVTGDTLEGRRRDARRAAALISSGMNR